MPDWRREAARLLSRTKFSRAERDDISRELGSYLDDLCDDSCANGQNESAATQFALDELHNDARLGPKLYRARKENSMHLNDRTKHFWLPGMSVLFASAGLYGVFQMLGLQPDFPVLWFHGGPRDLYAIYWQLMIYDPWLCALPFLGAAGACWSRRAGGSRAVRAAAAFFPVFVFFAILLGFLFARIVIGGLPSNVSVAERFFSEWSSAFVNCVVIPGVALLPGVLPFLLTSRNREGVVTAN